MDKKSPPEADQPMAGKILIIAILVLIAGSVAVTYWRIMVKKDYIITAQADCDPTTEKCFVWNCDPKSNVEGEACTGDSEKDVWYYQIINRKAFNIPLCDPNDENCTALTCPEGEKDCSVEFCDEKTKKKENVCSDPETYIKEHPEALEENAECDPATDETCTTDENQCDPATDKNCTTDQSSNATDTTDTKNAVDSGSDANANSNAE